MRACGLLDDLGMTRLLVPGCLFALVAAGCVGRSLPLENPGDAPIDGGSGGIGIDRIDGVPIGGDGGGGVRLDSGVIDAVGIAIDTVGIDGVGLDFGPIDGAPVDAGCAPGNCPGDTLAFETSAVDAGLAQPLWVIAVDLDGDGRPDLVAGDGYQNTISVLINQGGGRFASPVVYPVGAPTSPGQPGAVHLEAHDVDGDGHPDLVVASEGENRLHVLYNQGDGTLRAGPSLETGPYDTGWVTAADLDGDGRLDLVAGDTGGEGRATDGVVTVYLQQADGSFSRGTQLTGGGYLVAVQAADFDGDGAVDLLVTGSAVIDQDGFHPQRFLLFPGRGDGSFGAAVESSSGGSSWPPVLADVDGDGQLDLVNVNQNPDGSSAAVSIFRGTGDGHFAAASAVSTALVGSGACLLVDLDGDQAADLACSYVNPGRVSVFSRLSPTAFDAGRAFGDTGEPTAWGANHITRADLDGDGRADLVTTDQFSGRLVLYLNRTAPPSR
jgi:hypothetical protein